MATSTPTAEASVEPSVPPSPPRPSAWKWILLAALALALTAFLLIGGEDASAPAAMASVPVQRGEFVISLMLKNGELEAVNSNKVTAPRVRGELKIVQLWPEGEQVDIGDLIVQFDPGDFKREVAEDEEALEVAKAELEKMVAEQEVEIARLESDIEGKDAALRLAELRVEKMRFEADVAKQEAVLQAKRAQLDLEQARKKLETQKTVHGADRTKQELAIVHRERELDKSRRDLEQLSIHAEKPGLVVYEKVWKGGRTEKVRIGDTPWGGQSLIDLPDLSRMQVKTFVNEVDVDKLQTGQKVLIKLDALPEPTFHGTITSVATLGHEKEGERNVKVFDVLIAVEEQDERLKPGMSANSDVIIETIPPRVESRPDSIRGQAPEVAVEGAAVPLYVPLDAVFEKEGRTVVYRVGSGGAQEREVKLGKKNANHVIIEEGLAEGDRVALRDPTASLDQIGGLSEEDEAADKKGAKGE